VSECIRHARPEDLPEILAIYAHARRFMKENGNPTQWGDTRPSEELVRQDIARQINYVCEIDGKVEGVFVLISEPEPTYAVIEEGSWIGQYPYHTVHRIASAGRVPGIFSRCIRWCYDQFGHLRIDTHHNNHIMQHLITSHGFTRCGIVYMEDGAPRIAYEKL